MAEVITEVEVKKIRKELAEIKLMLRGFVSEIKEQGTWVPLKRFLKDKQLTYDTVKSRWERHPELSKGRHSTRQINVKLWEERYGG